MFGDTVPDQLRELNAFRRRQREKLIECDSSHRVGSLRRETSVRPTYHAFSCAAGSGCNERYTCSGKAEGAEALGEERAASGATRSWTAASRDDVVVLRVRADPAPQDPTVDFFSESFCSRDRHGPTSTVGRLS